MKTVKLLLAALLLVQVVTLGVWLYWLFFEDIDDASDCPAETTETPGIGL